MTEENNKNQEQTQKDNEMKNEIISGKQDEVKTEVKPEEKSEIKSEVKPEVKADVITEVKQEEKFEVNNVENVQSQNNFEEVPVFQEVNPQKKTVRTDSYFDGGLLELIGWKILAALITGVTFGIAYPWAKCMLYSWQIKHTVYNGKRLKFEGTGGELFVNMFKWFFFTLITLGIYAFVIPVRKARWVVSNIHYEDEPLATGESFFDGHTLPLIGINILCNILTICSLGILYPFTVCLKLRWINKHVVINRKKLVFDGKALSLWGKYILWTFLTLITFGIYGLWLGIKMLKWQTKHTHIKTVGEPEQKDNSLLIAIPIVILALAVGILGISTLLTKVDFEEFEGVSVVQNIGRYLTMGGGIKENKPKGDYSVKQERIMYHENY